MTTRDLPSSAATADGEDTLDIYHALITALLDASVLPLTSVGGTANAITADVDPEMPASGLVAGMKFSVTWASANTATAVTLNVDGSGAKDIVTASNGVLTVGQIAAGRRDIVEYDGTSYRLMTGGATQTDGASEVFEYLSSDTWTNNYSAGRLVFVELWGAGQGGKTSGPPIDGGDGGEYAWGLFRAGDLGATETIVVPSTTATGSNGGDCTFGSVLAAKGGGKSGAASARTWEGGGSATTISLGSNAIMGGGAGGNSTGTVVAGTSRYGGNGGAGGVAGSVPGGGGGALAQGGAGKARVTVF